MLFALDPEREAVVLVAGTIPAAGRPGQAVVAVAVTEAYDIDHDDAAGQRQVAAVKASGDRRHELAGVAAPTLVVHGEDAPMQSWRACAATGARHRPRRVESDDLMSEQVPV